MALFALWRQSADMAPADRIHRRLAAEAHVVPERTFRHACITASGAWNLAAFATTTRYHAAADQLWWDDGGGCVIHGLVWRADGDRPVLLDARAVAMLLDRPGATLPSDVCGEYAILRLHPCGTVVAFSDRAGLHQIFYDHADPGVVANRAGFVATVRDDWRCDPRNGLWLATIGYRIGETSAHAVARMVRQEHALTIDAAGQRLTPLPDPIVAFPPDRSFDDILLDQGIVQARAAIRLATDDEPVVELPITGGKDSRAVLALCLAAGLRDRLRLFTRGYEGHPDVVAGRAIAAACGLPYERQPPLGSDQPAWWGATTFVDNMGTQAFQTDGMMGGWDFILGRTVGTETLLTGHMGEVLKAYAKRPPPQGPLDPVAMVRGQAPFDPMGLLRPDARASLVAELTAQMDRVADAGATHDDQGDVFYYRNRLPNWLGGIRGIKAFERQPVMPLGVPALMRLAFRMTPAERRAERAHAAIVHRCAPELVASPFALQRWGAGAFGDAGDPPAADPVLPAPGAPPVFGNWQYSLNHVPTVRAALADLVATRDLGLWHGIDRDAVRDRLRHRRFDYFDGISMLGIVAAVFAQAGCVVRTKIGSDHGTNPSDGTRPIDPAMRGRVPGTPWPVAIPTLHGHLDSVHDGRTLVGWVHAPDFPGARPAVVATVGGAMVAGIVADRPRADLVRAGLDDGDHGFALPLPPDIAGDVVLSVFDAPGFTPIDGHVRIEA